jgi:hypothetical protein
MEHTIVQLAAVGAVNARRCPAPTDSSALAPDTRLRRYGSRKRKERYKVRKRHGVAARWNVEGVCYPSSLRPLSLMNHVRSAVDAMCMVGQHFNGTLDVILGQEGHATVVVGTRVAVDRSLRKARVFISGASAAGCRPGVCRLAEVNKG